MVAEDRPQWRDVSVTPNTNEPWEILAGLRFLLASLVVCVHINVLACKMINPWLLPIAKLGAFAAVLCFFVISGYSIAASVEREKSGFYSRRFLRLAPAYWSAYLFSLVPIVFFGWSVCPPEYRPHGLFPILLNGLCLQTFLTPQSFYFGPSWTLACEVIYYALAPALNRLSTNALVLLAGTSVSAYLVHAYFGHADYWYEIYGISTVCLAWAWIAGFVFYRHRTSIWAKALLIVLCSVLSQMNPFQFGPLTWLTVLAVMTLIVAAPKIRLGAGSARLLQYLGELSYPLYLMHFTFVIMVYNASGKQHYVPWPLYYIGSVALSACVVHVIERPVKRLFARRSKAEADGVQPEFVAS